MKTIKEFVNKKYAEKEVGKTTFDAIVEKMKGYAREDCYQNGNMGGELVGLLDDVKGKRKDLSTDVIFGAVAGAMTVIGGGVSAMAQNDAFLMAMGTAGVVCGGTVLFEYLHDKKKLKEAKFELKKYLEYKFASASYPDMSKSSIEACIDETCDELVDDFENGKI